MTDILNVWIGDLIIGQISSNEGRWQFTYSAEWLSSNDNYALSPFLNLHDDPYIDTADDKRVEWFFENLLPEGGVREVLARQASLSKNDAYGFISKYGNESAGALTILPRNIPMPDGRYVEMSNNELVSRINNSSASSLLSSTNDLHMSLAGVQNKLAIFYSNETFFLPKGQCASSHIIKPDNISTDYPFCPANEFFCMRLAQAVGLQVPKVNLLHIPNAIYMIKRFDRQLTDAGLSRKHQIDLCQLLNMWVGYKYESNGGITTHDLFDSVTKLAQPAIERGKIIKWIIFNFIIGNSDAHGKNISYTVNKNSILTLAPFYDLLCVKTYIPDSNMAMSIGSEDRYGWVEQAQWQALAKEANVKLTLIFSYIKEISGNIKKHINDIVELSEFTIDEKEFITNRIILVIDEHLRYLK